MVILDTRFITEDNKLIITRTFKAPVVSVWQAWAEPTLLDQWWAPKPWVSKTKLMDFREGGYRLYSMSSPKGEVHWGRVEYRAITPHQSFSGADFFTDELGEVNPLAPVTKFRNVFVEESGQTVLTITNEYRSAQELQAVMEMGLREGLSMAFQNLDSLLATSSATS